MINVMETATTIGIQPKPPKKEYTYQDFLDLPDDGRRYEIIEGDLFASNAPNIDHQFTVMKIAFQLKRFVSEHELGYVLTAPFEIHLAEKTRPVQPDVFFIKKENWPPSRVQFFAGAPDLVVEVLSPSTQRTDQVVKFDLYEKVGVAEYWIVNPKTRSVELFILSAGEYALVNEYVADEVIESQLLAGLTIVTSSLFNPIH